jgi:HK97 family phage prohead protease
MPYSVTTDAADCDGYAVVKDDGTVMGCHDSEEDAEDQLTALRISENDTSRMDAFDRLDHLLAKADVSDLSEGDLVMWDSSGGTAYGRVDAIATESSLESSLRDEPMEASEDNPAIRIELVDRVDGEIEGRGETVLHRPGTLSMASEDDVKAAPSPERKSSVGQRRTMAFETKDFAVKQDDDTDEFIFDAYGAVFGNKDRGGDILQQGSFKRTIDHNDGKFPLIADHDMALKSRLGVAYAEEDSRGVKVEGHINTDTQAGREVASHIRHAEKHDLPLGMSFGYEVMKDDFDDQKGARLLKEVKNYEFTVTQIPMNPEAQVQGVKGILDDDSAMHTLAKRVASLLTEDPSLRDTLTKALDAKRSADSATDGDSDADEVIHEIRSLTQSIRSSNGTE